MALTATSPSSLRTAGPDPQALLALRDLELRVRMVMEGLRIGLHRSPFRGHSVEFAEYRPYSAGDDLRRLDWRVLARTDRLYLRQHDEDTNLRCWLMLDTSRSMSFGSRPAVPKVAYARTLVATLASLLQQQGDAPGFVPFDEQLRVVLPPAQRPGHLRRLFAALEREPADRSTEIGAALQAAGRLLRRRSLVILISDFLVPVEQWAGRLAELVASGHDLRAVQVLDPAEPGLETLERAALWEDLESGQSRYVDPQLARPGYRARFEAHAQAVRETFAHHGVPHLTVLTNEPFDRALHRLFVETPPARRTFSRKVPR